MSKLYHIVISKLDDSLEVYSNNDVEDLTEILQSLYTEFVEPDEYTNGELIDFITDLLDKESYYPLEIEIFYSNYGDATLHRASIKDLELDLDEE